MKIIETKVFTFDELGEKAKERARDWYREDAYNYEWWDAVYEDANTIGALLGFTDMKIQFSGFSSQGDGASFTATWRAPKAPVKAVKSHAPKDEKMHALAAEAWGVVRKMMRDERLDSFQVYRTGREVHEGSMGCYHEGVKELARSFAQWVYRQLEAEWDYLNSDEQVDESIGANEYTFTEDGRRFG